MAKDAAYLAAEKKIEEAQLSNATNLVLTNIGLTEIPDSLRMLTQLRSLNLSNNRLTALPEWIGDLTQLQELRLTSNKISSFPNSLQRKLRFLKFLVVGLEHRIMRIHFSASRLDIKLPINFDVS
jgi:Leucine-rich repeat (LRR) protein